MREMEVVCHVEVYPWKVFVDVASSAMGTRTGIVIITPEGIRLEHSFRLDFKASNNEAEYEALLTGLKAVRDMGAREVEVYSDSWLVVNQVQGSFEARDSRMMEYLWVVRQVMNQFLKAKVIQMAKGQNRHANSLAILVSSLTEEVPRLIKVELVAELV